MEITTSNSNTNSTNILSILVSLNGLSFCITDNNKTIITLENEDFGIQLTPSQTLDKIKIAFEECSFLQEDFKTIEVLYQNDLYALVPKALFNEDSLKEYLKYSIRVLENDFIAYDEISQLDIVNVYIPYININNFFFETFGSFTYRHTTSILLSTFLSKEKNAERTVVYAHMNKKHMDLLVFENGKLLLGNTFFYENEEDFLYYLLFVSEQLRLNPEEFELVFTGKISKNSDCYKIAYQYIRNIGFAELDDTLTFSNASYSLEHLHNYYVLLHTI